MTDRKPQSQDKFILRLPDGMREEIKMHAERNQRSMNAEIVARLDSSLGGASRSGPLVESGHHARAHLQHVARFIDRAIEAIEKHEPD